MCIRLMVKHIVTECQKYDSVQQRTKIDGTLDSSLGPKTGDNSKMIDFLKASALYNLI